MDRSEITWYSLDENLNTQEHEAVSFSQAINVIDQYFAKLKPFYETGEEALANTLFGFSKAETTFIEICIHSLSAISFKFEAPGNDVSWYQKLRKKAHQYEWMLSSREEVIVNVQQFFLRSPEEYREYLEKEVRG
jgi:hypothetical protein